MKTIFISFQAPSSLLEALEAHLASLEANRKGGSAVLAKWVVQLKMSVETIFREQYIRGLLSDTYKIVTPMNTKTWRTTLNCYSQ